ncbi:MAG: hypothetical protein ACI8PT_001389, partial [Gammaproteobacteria bacterium]
MNTAKATIREANDCVYEGAVVDRNRACGLGRG